MEEKAALPSTVKVRMVSSQLSCFDFSVFLEEENNKHNHWGEELKNIETQET